MLRIHFSTIHAILPALLVLGLVACASNPYPPYAGYGPPPGSVTPTIPYYYAPGVYGAPYGYPYGYAYGYYGYGPGNAWYPGYWNSAPPTIVGVTPTLPKPPPITRPLVPPPPPVIRRRVIQPCYPHHTRNGTTVYCP